MSCIVKKLDILMKARTLQFFSAAPDYNCSSDESFRVRPVGVTALHYSFGDHTLSGKVTKFPLAHSLHSPHTRTHKLPPSSHSPLGRLKRKKDKFRYRRHRLWSLSLKSLYGVIEPGCWRVVLQPCGRQNLIKVRRAAASLSPYCDASANTD